MKFFAHGAILFTPKTTGAAYFHFSQQKADTTKQDDEKIHDSSEKGQKANP